MTSPVEDTEEDMSLLPVRRLHNYAYCPRLFYLQWVEGIFIPNEDTVAGSALHSRVDVPDTLKEEALGAEVGALRSIMLSSDTLGVVGTMDLLEDDGRLGHRLVDYKKGSPLRGKQGEWEAKPNDAIQLAAYALLLKEEGIRVDRASVYYAQVKKHVAVLLTDELFDTCQRFIKEARALAQTGICPPPLCQDARCFSCSAYPVCLPFETYYWMEGKKQEEGEKRPPMPEQDRGDILVVQNNRASVSFRGGEILVRLDGDIVSHHPLHQLSSVCLYGPVQVSAQALQALMEEGVEVSYFSLSGRFIGLAHGLPSSGVDARLGQARLWGLPEKRFMVASEIIRAKIHNQRVVLMRNGAVEKAVLLEMARLRDSCITQSGLSSLRGVEGAAAAIYFAHFSTMLKGGLSFDFNGRNKRPPKDAVNALLSWAYSLLAKELTRVAYTVGLDPYLGFFHSPRYGRPALALDMMEEFRPLIADSVALTVINRGEIVPDDFIYTTKGVLLKESGRRQFWRAWARRMDTEITHPTFGYKMSYRRMLHVQMRQFWRFCRGDITSYHGFTTR